jgi:hypothetical protein
MFLFKVHFTFFRLPLSSVIANSDMAYLTTHISPIHTFPYSVNING